MDRKNNLNMTTKQSGFGKLVYFLGLERMIAPVLIRMIYWVGMIAICIAGAVSFYNAGPTLGRLFLTLVALLLSLLIWRLVSELWILAFNIYQRLVEIRDLLSRHGQASAVIQPVLRDGD